MADVELSEDDGLGKGTHKLSLLLSDESGFEKFLKGYMVHVTHALCANSFNVILIFTEFAGNKLFQKTWE